MMKMTNLFFTIGVLFLLLGLSINAYGNTMPDGKDMNYNVSLSTDKTIYFVGEPIMMTLKIFNYTDEEITLKFNTSQRYEFIIEEKEGHELWRWSRGRMFTMVTGVEVLGPTNPEMIATETFSDRLIPGQYHIMGIFVSENRAMSGSVMIEVR